MSTASPFQSGALVNAQGINLQEHFDAVLHYDLAWNPTRHEQREDRADRFGQERPEVRVVTWYGADNPIDGVILARAREGSGLRWSPSHGSGPKSSARCTNGGVPPRGRRAASPSSRYCRWTRSAHTHTTSPERQRRNARRVDRRSGDRVRSKHRDRAAVR